MTGQVFDARRDGVRKGGAAMSADRDSSEGREMPEMERMIRERARGGTFTTAGSTSPMDDAIRAAARGLSGDQSITLRAAPAHEVNAARAAREAERIEADRRKPR